MIESENKEIVTKIIKNELKYLDVEVSYNGIRYLIETVYILYFYGDVNSKLERDVYPIIAKKYHTTVGNIKGNIYYAVNMIYIGCDSNKLLEYLEEYSICKISVKKLVIAILKKVNKKTMIF